MDTSGKNYARDPQNNLVARDPNIVVEGGLRIDGVMRSGWAGKLSTHPVLTQY